MSANATDAIREGATRGENGGGGSLAAVIVAFVTMSVLIIAAMCCLHKRRASIVRQQRQTTYASSKLEMADTIHSQLDESPELPAPHREQTIMEAHVGIDDVDLLPIRSEANVKAHGSAEQQEGSDSIWPGSSNRNRPQPTLPSMRIDVDGDMPIGLSPEELQQLADLREAHQRTGVARSSVSDRHGIAHGGGTGHEQVENGVLDGSSSSIGHARIEENDGREYLQDQQATKQGGGGSGLRRSAPPLVGISPQRFIASNIEIRTPGVQVDDVAKQRVKAHKQRMVAAAAAALRDGQVQSRVSLEAVPAPTAISPCTSFAIKKLEFAPASAPARANSSPIMPATSFDQIEGASAPSTVYDDSPPRLMPHRSQMEMLSDQVPRQAKRPQMRASPEAMARARRAVDETLAVCGSSSAPNGAVPRLVPHRSQMVLLSAQTLRPARRPQMRASPEAMARARRAVDDTLATLARITGSPAVAVGTPTQSNPCAEHNAFDGESGTHHGHDAANLSGANSRGALQSRQTSPPSATRVHPPNPPLEMVSHPDASGSSSAGIKVDGDAAIGLTVAEAQELLALKLASSETGIDTGHNDRARHSCLVGGETSTDGAHHDSGETSAAMPLSSPS